MGGRYALGSHYALAAQQQAIWGGLPGQHVCVNASYDAQFVLNKKEKQTMLKEVKNDLTVFVREHKSIIYWGILLFVLDRVYFNGAFRKKLTELANRFMAIAEDKIDQIGKSNEAKLN